MGSEEYKKLELQRQDQIVIQQKKFKHDRRFDTSFSAIAAELDTDEIIKSEEDSLIVDKSEEKKGKTLEF